MTKTALDRALDNINEFALGISGILEALENEVAEIGTISTSDELDRVCCIYQAVKLSHELIQQVGKVANDLEKHLSYKVLPQGFENLKKTVNGLKGIGKFTVAVRNSATIADEAEAFKWLEEIGEGGAIKQTVHYQTLNAIVSNYIENEGKEPPEAINLKKLRYVQLRKA